MNKKNTKKVSKVKQTKKRSSKKRKTYEGLINIKSSNLLVIKTMQIKNEIKKKNYHISKKFLQRITMLEASDEVSTSMLLVDI